VEDDYCGMTDKPKIKINLKEKVVCACPDHEIMNRYDKYDRERRYIQHHYSKGKLNYYKLHTWIRKHFLPPKNNKCPTCKKIVKRLQLCNISKEKNVVRRYESRDPVILATYNRDLRNWYYACSKCHLKSDGRLEALLVIGRHPSKNTKRKMSESRKKGFADGRVIQWNLGQHTGNQYSRKKGTVEVD
jgi:hypothetical protein